MSTQSWLDLWPSVRLYAGLETTGRATDPCDVVCRTCGTRETAPTFWAAQARAWAHDRECHPQGPS
jgi:hypothetical protein